MTQTTQPRRDGTGTCESCGHSFDYMLIHNGFNDSAFAYCDSCGMTALFDRGVPRRQTAGAGSDAGKVFTRLLLRADA